MRSLTLALACATLGLVPVPAGARVYSCEDDTGHIILRDVPCKRGEIDREPTPEEAPPAPAPPRAAPVHASKISESQARELGNGLSAAHARRDVKSILAFFAADAVYEMEYRLSDGTQLQRFNKDEYGAYLRDTFRLAEDSYALLLQPDILLSPGGDHAEIITTSSGVVLLRGEPMSGVTRSRVSVEIRDGRPQVTLVRAVATLTGSRADERAIKQKPEAAPAR